jgi:hypothetical protein
MAHALLTCALTMKDVQTTPNTALWDSVLKKPVKPLLIAAKQRTVKMANVQPALILPNVLI